jgi:hypothetical protein
MIDSTAFRSWFGKSKVVDARGKPLVVYHGTDSVFSSFRIPENGVAYFTPSENYGYIKKLPNVVAAYLSIQNPYMTTFPRVIEGLRSDPETVDELKKEGYDGVIYANPANLERGPSGWGNDYPQIAVFYPHQIKSVDNQGTFDPNDPDIRHNPRAPKPRGRTLVERGMPTKWWHGTRSQFATLKPQSSGCVWLADRAGATKYATPYYSKPGERWLLELDLAPDTSVVELADASDPIVRAYIDMINEAYKFQRLPFAYDDWANQDINFGILETERWSRGFFRKYGVDALLVRDVAGWSGYESMPSLCLLNTKKIQQSQRHALSNPKTSRRTDPALWSRIVAEVTASDKGGRPGQWSARKAQRAVALYQQRGGGYIGPKTPDNALAKWTREQWRTRSGRPSLETGERYLPTKALAALSPQEYGATTRAKRAGMAAGEQFVPQPERIAKKTSKYRKAKRNPCAHCSGRGYMSEYAHIAGGVCFACGGRG